LLAPDAKEVTSRPSSGECEDQKIPFGRNDSIYLCGLCADILSFSCGFAAGLAVKGFVVLR
jgi:hypothetical protein